MKKCTRRPTCGTIFGMRRLHAPARSAAALACAAALTVLSACGASEDALLETGADLAGVSGVTIVPTEEGSDETVVEVSVDDTAGTKEVMAVFEAYRDTLEDGDADAVSVVFDTAQAPRLTSGPERLPSAPMVEALLQARDDFDTSSFALTTVPERSQVDVSMVTGTPFSEAAQRADAYAAVKGVDVVSVRVGKVKLVNDPRQDEKLLRARVELVSELAADFDLQEAVVQGKGALDLIVASSSLQAVKVFLAVESDVRHGEINLSSN